MMNNGQIKLSQYFYFFHSYKKVSVSQMIGLIIAVFILIGAFVLYDLTLPVANAWYQSQNRPIPGHCAAFVNCDGSIVAAKDANPGAVACGSDGNVYTCKKTSTRYFTDIPLWISTGQSCPTDMAGACRAK